MSSLPDTKHTYIIDLTFSYQATDILNTVITESDSDISRILKKLDQIWKNQIQLQWKRQYLQPQL